MAETGNTTILSNLPAVVVSRVASFLPWTDKMALSAAIPSLGGYLGTLEAWRRVTFDDTCPYCDPQYFKCCLQTYGPYMCSLYLKFDKDIQHGCHLYNVDLLQEVLAYVHHLQELTIVNLVCHSNSKVMRRSLLVDILNKCNNLKSLHLITPLMYLNSQNNILVTLFQNKLTDRLKTLSIADNSFTSFAHFLNILADFESIEKLRIRRDRLQKTTLRSLVENKLRCLYLHQDEDGFSRSDTPDSLLYDDKLWRYIVHCQPEFQLHVTLHHVYLVRPVFPTQAPIVSLILVDIPSSITQGLLENIIDCYAHSLTTFMCVWIGARSSSGFKLEDRRVNAMLPEFFRKCEKLKYFAFRYAMTKENFVEVIEKAPLIKELVIADDVFVCICNRDDGNRDTREQHSHRVIRCKNLLALEEKASFINGTPWKFTSVQELRTIVENSSCLS